MNQHQKFIFVVAGLLKNDKKQCLLAQRPKGKDMQGFWEFPGGKLQEGEIPEIALQRELQEELGIVATISAMKPLSFISHAYEDFHLFMPLYDVKIWDGVPEGKEGQKIEWVAIEQLLRINLVPADIPLAQFIQGL